MTKPSDVRLWYLATPYTRFPAGHQAAYVLACRLTAKLFHKSIPVFCPIAHSHGVAEYGELDVLDHDLWMNVNEPLLAACDGLIVAMAEGWSRSRGVTAEIEHFKSRVRPIIFWEPTSDVPLSLYPDNKEKT